MRRAALVALAALAAACAAPGGADSAPAAPVPAAVPAPAVVQPIAARPDLAMVLAASASAPRNAVALAEIAVNEGLREQAGLTPNPVVGLSAERLFENRADRGVPKWRLSGRQRIETAGKRAARVEVAEGLVADAGVRAERERILVAEAAALLWIRIRAGERRAALLREQAGASGELLALAERRRAAGRAREDDLPPLRAKVAEWTASAAEEEAALAEDRRVLEGLLGWPDGAIQGVDGEMPGAGSLPAAGGEGAFLATNPEMRALASARTVAAARTRQAETLAWPDVDVMAMAEDDEEGMEGTRHDHKVGLGFEVPLPLFDRNQGNIAAARAEERRAEAAIREAEARLRAEYDGLAASLATLGEARRALAGEALPARERARTLAAAARDAGRTDAQPEVEARVDVLEVRLAVLDLDARIAERAARALALLGRPPEEWVRR